MKVEAEPMDVGDTDAKESEDPSKSKKPRKSKKTTPADEGEVNKTKKGRSLKNVNKPKGSPGKKAPKRGDPALSTEDSLEKAREDAKEAFENEKAAILAELPHDYKSDWGQVGFAKWHKDLFPVVVVGPYDVGPGTDARTMWMSMFEKERDRRTEMTLMVFWYGTINFEEAYGFIHPGSFKPYDGGADALMDNMPPKIQKKIDDGSKKLSKTEQFLARGLEEMRTEIAMEPEERRRKDPSFKELHEDDKTLLILIGDYVEEKKGLPSQKRKGPVTNREIHEKRQKTPNSESTMVVRGEKKPRQLTQKKLPSWITDEPGELEPLTSDAIDRAVALDVLKRAASRFPEDQVNKDAIARSLEAAVYEWWREQEDKKEGEYWIKLTAVVAGIFGKKERPGFIVASILAGEYASAKDVVSLPQEIFDQSFIGPVFELMTGVART